MNYPLFVVIFTIAVWIFTPFKQYKSDFFYFFLILALSDPIKLVAFYVLRINPQHLSIAVAFLLISSLVSYSKQRYFFVILSILAAAIFLSYSIQRNILILSIIGAHLIIFLVLVNYTIKYIEKAKAINLFLMLLITYEFINIIKFIAGLLSYEQGSISFYLGTFTQIFFGIIFSFITIKTKDFPLFVKD